MKWVSCDGRDSIMYTAASHAHTMLTVAVLILCDAIPAVGPPVQHYVAVNNPLLLGAYNSCFIVGVRRYL